MLLWKHTGSSRMLLASTTHDFRVWPLQSELMVLFVAPLLHYKGSCQSTINILITVWREKRPTSVHFEEDGALRHPYRSNTKLNGSLRIPLSCYKQASLGYMWFMRMRGNHRHNCSANAISRDLNFVMRASAVVCVVCGGSALTNLDIPTLEVCLCLFFHCLRMA